MLTGHDLIIHRSKFSIVTHETDEDKKRRAKREQERDIRGWKAPENKPYLPLGDFENVIPVIEGVKEIFPNIHGMGTEAMSNLKQLRSNRKPFLRGPHPRRVMNILEHSKPILEELYKNERSEANKRRNKSEIVQAKGNKQLDYSAITGEKPKASQPKPSTSNSPRLNNQRLNTPTLKKLALINDGAQALKDEINESYLRVKAAKHGMKLGDIVPPHGMRFYLPNKINYISPKAHSQYQLYQQAQTVKNATEREKDVLGSKGDFAVQEKNGTTFITGLATEKQSKPRRDISFEARTNLNQSLNLFWIKKGPSKNSLNKTQIMQGSANKTISKIKFRNNILASAGAKIPARINSVSNRFNREQNVPLVDQRRKIRLVSMIDSKPISHYITLKTLKEFAKSEQESVGVPGSFQMASENKGPKNHDFYKILKEDLSKFESRRGPMNDTSNIGKDDDSYDGSLKSKEHHLNPRASRIPDQSQDSKYQPTLSEEAIVDEKIKNYINADFANEIEYKYKKEIIELHEFYKKLDRDMRDQENAGENKIENEEQARRLQQLKREQELADFEEKGGFARILRNFFNPTDESIELDSVYQLKQLCKSYYETKSKISKELIETLDAMINERPNSIVMKKKSIYNNSDEDAKEDPRLGKLHKNFYLDIECMRLNAEKERICHYRDIARQSAIMYYKILRHIMKHIYAPSKSSPEKQPEQAKTEKKASQPNFYQQKETKMNCVYYVTDYLKLVVENGNKFTQDHLYHLFDTMIFEELNDDVITTFKLIIKELSLVDEQFDEDKFKSFVDKEVSDPRKQAKLLDILVELEEPAE